MAKDIARVFMSGRSQAVRILTKLRFGTSEVPIVRKGTMCGKILLGLSMAGMGVTASAATVTLDTVGNVETLYTASNWSNGVSPTDVASARDDYVAAQAGKIVVDSPAKNYRGTVQTRVNADGSVTFVAAVGLQGMMVIVRWTRCAANDKLVAVRNEAM